VTYHIVVGLPDGRTAYADSDEPVAAAMHRVNNKIMDNEHKRDIGYPGSPRDYELISAWLDDNEALSQSCRVGLWPGVTCIHDKLPGSKVVVLPSRGARMQGTGRYDAATIKQALTSIYRFTKEQADYIVRYTMDDREHPSKEWKTRSGFITLRYFGADKFALEDSRGNSGKALPISRRKRYNPESKGIPEATSRKDSRMPPTARGRRSTAPPPAPEPEPESNGVVDFQRYLDKDLTPTMQDFVVWFEENVAELEDVPIDKLLTLGPRLYGQFQRSDFNRSQREARRSERAERRRPEPEPEPEPEPAPARRGRGRPAAKAAAAPARSAARSAPAKPAPEQAAAPARRGRRSSAKSSAEAPY
jgi:hypothetical protein